MTAIDAAMEPGEGQASVSAFLVLQEEGGGQTVRWWEILSKLRSSLESGVGHPALVGTGRGRWLAERTVAWSLLSNDLATCDNEENHQIRKKGRRHFPGRCPWLASFTRRPAGSDRDIENVKVLHPRSQCC